MPRITRSKSTPSVPHAAGGNVTLPRRPAKRRKTVPQPLLPPKLSFSYPDAVSHLCRFDPRFRKLFDTVPCKPFQEPIEAVDPFRTLVTSIIGQQVSWMAARAITKRFREYFDVGEDDFPTAAQVAKEEPPKIKEVGLSMRKAEYVICLAQHFEDGRLSTELLRDGTDEEVTKALIAVRGIGQWTVDMFLMFSLRRPNVMPYGDLGVQKGLLRWALAAHGGLPQPKSKASAAARQKYGLNGEVPTADGIETRVLTPPPENAPPPTTPQTATLISVHGVPPTPLTPSNQPVETVEVPAKDLATSLEQDFLSPPSNHSFDPHVCAPLAEGLSVELMRSRLAGKKAKGGAYLTPKEMDVLTEGWKPFASLGVYYTWPMGEDL